MPNYVTLRQIDESFFNLFEASYSGNEIESGAFTVNSKTVNLFFGGPAFTENTPDRLFPSICIELSDPPRPNPDLLYLDNVEGEFVSRNLGENPTQTLSSVPRAYIVSYKIHALSRNTNDDRDLITKVLSVITHRGVFEINEALWHYYMREASSQNYVLEDQFVYHRIWDIDIEVFIDFGTGKTQPIVTNPINTLGVN